MFHLIDEPVRSAKRGSRRGPDYSRENKREERLRAGWAVLHQHWPAHGRTPYIIKARFVELEDKRESHEW